MLEGYGDLYGYKIVEFLQCTDSWGGEGACLPICAFTDPVVLADITDYCLNKTFVKRSKLPPDWLLLDHVIDLAIFKFREELDVLHDTEYLPEARYC